jgi:hypothetical protein
VAAGRKFDSGLLAVPGAVSRNDGGPRADKPAGVAFAGSIISGTRDIAQCDLTTNAVACDAWATNHDALDD